MKDPITDMFNQIKNALAVRKTEVIIPFSRLKQEIAQILVEEGFVLGIKKTVKKDKETLKINLKQDKNNPIIFNLKRISKPGQRIYVKTPEIRPVKSGKGISIISTSKGLMTNKRAKKEKLGGELICQIW